MGMLSHQAHLHYQMAHLQYQDFESQILVEEADIRAIHKPLYQAKRDDKGILFKAPFMLPRYSKLSLTSLITSPRSLLVVMQSLLGDGHSRILPAYLRPALESEDNISHFTLSNSWPKGDFRLLISDPLQKRQDVFDRLEIQSARLSIDSQGLLKLHHHYIAAPVRSQDFQGAITDVKAQPTSSLHAAAPVISIKKNERQIYSNQNAERPVKDISWSFDYGEVRPLFVRGQTAISHCIRGALSCDIHLTVFDIADAEHKFEIGASDYEIILHSMMRSGQGFGLRLINLTLRDITSKFDKQTGLQLKEMIFSPPQMHGQNKAIFLSVGLELNDK